jgi:hypothetical protein
VTALLLTASGFGTRALDAVRPLLGPGFVRAEIVTREGGALHDYRVDRGRIRQVRPGQLTLRELDGTVVTISVAEAADIRLGGRAVTLAQLRRGMNAITIRDGDVPAQRVVATAR